MNETINTGRTKTSDFIAGSIYFGIMWLFVCGVSAFFSYTACFWIWWIGVLTIILGLLKGGYNGIFRKREHAY